MTLAEKTEVTAKQVEQELADLDREYASKRDKLTDEYRRKEGEAKAELRRSYIDRRRKLKRLLAVLEAEPEPEDE